MSRVVRPLGARGIPPTTASLAIMAILIALGLVGLYVVWSEAKPGKCVKSHEEWAPDPLYRRVVCDRWKDTP